MADALDLVRIADLYAEAAGGLLEKTVSHRVFGDSKKLSMIRAGSDITLGRFNYAMSWFAAFWPEGVDRPPELDKFMPGHDADTQRGAA